MLYFSYAANLNRSHMARLCPGAELLSPAALEGYTLTVRRWFNVEPLPGGSVCGGIWKIRPEHLPGLDSYEDCPELYERRMVEINLGERGREVERVSGRETVSCLIYVMKEPFAIPLSPPDAEYLEMVRKGYMQWGLPSDQLERALLTARS